MSRLNFPGNFGWIRKPQSAREQQGVDVSRAAMSLSLGSSREPPSSSSTLDWKFGQVFGERAPHEDVQDIDVITSIDFEKKGDFLAVGDKGGRVVIFERKNKVNTSKKVLRSKELEELDFPLKTYPEFEYKTEFQSHEPEFDCLSSVEIEEKINKVKWCTTPNGPMHILSTNDRTIKLWKIKDHKMKKVKEKVPNPHVSAENAFLAADNFENGHRKPSNGYLLEWIEPRVENISTPEKRHPNDTIVVGDSASPKCRKVYANAHSFNVNSISKNSDCETFISADDLRINLWNLEISDQCFNIIDMKPPNIDDLIEVITSAEFHPVECNLFAYSSSRGFMRLVDMRQSALCDRGARIFRSAESRGVKSFFTELVASISDIKFAYDGRHILSRDYMNLKLWDTRMETSPVTTYKIHEHLRPKLSDLYNNDAIFDKFGCCLSRDGLHFATGSYSGLLRIFTHGIGREEVTVEADRNSNRKSHLEAVPSRRRRSSLSSLTRKFHFNRQDDEHHRSSISDELDCDLGSKMLHLAWHPLTNLIACAAGNSLFTYYA